jgi:tRNA(Ile)-lysidine synthase
MLKLLGHLEAITGVAVSGGPDSMAALHFLSRHRKMTAYFFHHGTETSDTGERLLRFYCGLCDIPLEIGRIVGTKPDNLSMEEWWRNQRLDWFRSVGSGQIATAHNLNDAAEWWLMTSFRGKPRLIPYQNGKMVKPFLLTPKEDLVSWCARNCIPYLNDPGNLDYKYDRSRVRHAIMPEVLKINPGFLKTVRKLYD